MLSILMFRRGMEAGRRELERRPSITRSNFYLQAEEEVKKSVTLRWNSTAFLSGWQEAAKDYVFCSDRKVARTITENLALINSYRAWNGSYLSNDERRKRVQTYDRACNALYSIGLTPSHYEVDTSGRFYVHEVLIDMPGNPHSIYTSVYLKHVDFSSNEIPLRIKTAKSVLNQVSQSKQNPNEKDLKKALTCLQYILYKEKSYKHYVYFKYFRPGYSPVNKSGRAYSRPDYTEHGISLMVRLTEEEKLDGGYKTDFYQLFVPLSQITCIVPCVDVETGEK